MCPLVLHLANNGVRWPRKPAGNNNDHDVSRVVCAYSVLTVSHLFLSKFCLETWKMGPSIILCRKSHSHILLEDGSQHHPQHMESQSRLSVSPSGEAWHSGRAKEKNKANNLPTPSVSFCGVLQAPSEPKKNKKDSRCNAHFPCQKQVVAAKLQNAVSRLYSASISSPKLLDSYQQFWAILKVFIFSI